MKEVCLEIDGKEIKAKEGMTLLEAAKELGIEIPTICYHEKLAPYGACRLCSVEIIRDKRSQIVASCLYPVEEGLIVRTSSPRLIKGRRMLIEMMLAIAPGVKFIEELAAEYGVKGTRFEREPSFCVRCGLCVRYCTEIKKNNACGFVGRGVTRRVVLFPVSSKTCPNCNECYAIYPAAKTPSASDFVCFIEPTLDDFLRQFGQGR